MAAIRVLVVEDSLTVRRRLCEVLAADPALEVVGEAEDGKRAMTDDNRTRSAPVSRIAYLYWFLKVTLTVPLHVFFRPHVSGVGRVPSSGPAILACNHTSWLDIIIFSALVRMPD